MDTGGLAQMSHNNSFASPTGLNMPSGGLASRRGGQNIKPLSFDAIKSSADAQDNGAPTPRTSRSHLLAGLRTAPKSATATTFAQSATSGLSATQQANKRNSMGPGMFSTQDVYNAPKTSMPRISTQQAQQTQQVQQQQVQQQQAQQQAYNQLMGYNQQQYTPDQILAPELHLDEQTQEQMDPSVYAQLVATNVYLARQKQELQQRLLHIQAAAQQFQGLSLNGQAALQQQLALQSLYQQQQQLNSLQQAQQNIYTYYDPMTGQQAYYVDQAQAQAQAQYAQLSALYGEQPATPQNFGYQQVQSTPRVQVSPPPMENEKPFFRSSSPPKKFELTAEPTPLPPPSANAFRRGHKKASSIAANKGLAVSTTGTAEEAPKSAGPRSAAFPLSPLPTGYMPGQARAGEHPVRQPRGPPAMDELRAKPTAKHEGSKNFAARTRRSAVHNLVRAGLERRKGTGSSTGSMSPVSESAEEAGTPLTDNESDSGRSGSGSLSGDAEPSLASSRTSTSGSWGAIGSDRPGSRQKSRKSVDSLSSASESGDQGSFASVFKHGSQRAAKTESPDGQRKAPMLVLTSAEKRKSGILA